MQNHKKRHRLIGLLVVIVVFASPLLGQQKRNVQRKPAAAEPAEPVPTFDSLLAAESYKVYCEVRGVGGLVRSPAVNDLLDPVMKLSKPSREFKTAVNWLNAHAEVLAGSRMMVAAWPSRPDLPTFLVAIEFSSPEEAKKFYPELRDFLPKLLPTPTPTPSPSPAPTQTPAPQPEVVIAGPADHRATLTKPVVISPDSQSDLRAIPEPQAQPYQMRQIGSLVLISDKQFKARDLRPRGSKPLEEDQNFIVARNRFSSESLFLYVDVKSIEKEEKERQKNWQEEEQKRIEAEAANPNPNSSISETMSTQAELMAPPVVGETPPPIPEPSISPEPAQSDSQASSTGTLSAGPSPMFFSLYSALFGGETKWPEAVGAAVVFEGDAYIVRTLIMNGDENKSNPIPFVPQFVSGPAIVPESPNIFPADTDLFVSVSLDYPQVYEGMLKSIAHAEAMSRKYNPQLVKEGPEPGSPFDVYEQKLGFKIKDDLLPLLGNEIALALPRKALTASKEDLTNPGNENPAPEDAGSKATKVADPSPVIAISIKDREAVGRLIPKIVESLGLKGANLFAQTEKRDGTELTSYAGVFAYAFVGNFLVVSPDAAETRRVVDAYLNHQTLSSNSHFKNFTRWQPRQLLGQVYVGPDLMQTYNPFALILAGSGSSKMNDFLSRLSPLIEPTTYALSNDGVGPLHELHLPKNLLLWTIGATFAGSETAQLTANESAAQALLRTLHSAEATFQATEGNGRYGTLDELVSANLITKELIQRYGYRIEVAASGSKFEAIAVPIEYGTTGRLSYFIDESGVLRAGDHGGGAATVADSPAQ